MAKDITTAFQFDEPLDDRALEVYRKALAGVAKANFSYVELRTAVQKLTARGMSPTDALSSVLVTAETMGQDGTALLKSAQAHLDKLERERVKIEEAMRTRLTDGMAKDRARIEAAAKKQADIKLKIAALEKELTTAEAKETELKAELSNAHERVEEQGRLLEEVHGAFHRAISEDIAAMRDL